jgi:hypothetical protein
MLFSTALHNRVTDNPEHYLKDSNNGIQSLLLRMHPLEALSLEGTKQQGWLTLVIEDN